MGATIFFLLGAVYLFINTIKDLKTKLIDDRHNYFMIGVSTCLIFISNINIWALLIVLGIVLLGIWGLAKTRLYGEGDYTAFGWITIGLLYFGWFWIIQFWFLMMMGTVIVYIISRVHKANYPAYPVIFMSFVLVWLLYALS